MLLYVRQQTVRLLVSQAKCYLQLAACNTLETAKRPVPSAKTAIELLRARGVEEDLMALAEQASGTLSDEARTAGAAVLQRAEQALTTPQ